MTEEQIRQQPYTARPSLYRLPGERIPAWVCTCRGLKKAHLEPWLCLEEDIVLTYWLTHPATTYRVVRRLAWLAETFSR